MFHSRKPVEKLDTGKIDTIVGEVTELRGSICSTGVVRIDGLVEGTIEHNGHLIIGPSGRLLANVKAKEMVVAGEIRGDLEVEGRLELLSGSRMVGDIYCGHLVVHEGATFHGRSTMLFPNDIDEAGKTSAKSE